MSSGKKLKPISRILYLTTYSIIGLEMVQAVGETKLARAVLKINN